MRPDELVAWRKRHALTQADAANHLGIAKSTLEQYEKGARRADGSPITIPKYIDLATEQLTLDWAVEHSNVLVTTRAVREKAALLTYLLSLPTFVGGHGAGAYNTKHDALRATGIIPADEFSFMERLFPYGDPRAIRKEMYATPKEEITE